MAKRKAVDVGDGPVATRRSSRRKTADESTKEEPSHSSVPKTLSKTTKLPAASKKSKKPESTPQIDTAEAENERAPAAPLTNDITGEAVRQYWLMKAEPESRIEKGVDIKFSIDDLAAKKEPEPWDGIRNFVARNNMRAMKKGDMAFFYHSSCKVPAIVGTMEIVAEHTPDLTAQNPSKPYYDPKDNKADSPKWSVVHVEFREKFKVPIELTTLRELSKQSDGLEGLQMLKQTRLSVSKVEEGEWKYLLAWEQKKANE